MTTLPEILPKLKAKFPPEAHKERELPGGKKTWWYVPWQLIRDRLDEVCPDWQVDYGEPQYLDKYCHISCTLTICGVSRKAVGNAQIELISGKGNDMARGTPIERAIADAFKGAAEAFGIAAYLDEQADEATKAEFIQYMHKHGNSKPAVQWQNEQRESMGQVPKPKPKDQPMPFGQKPEPPKTTTPTNETKARFAKIVKWTGHNVSQIRNIAQGFGLPADSSRLSETQADRLRDELFVDWGVAQQVFKNPFEARNSLKKLQSSFETPDIDDYVLWQAWQAKIDDKKQKRTA